ncbi:hypothetical protein NOK75_00850 [Vibrio parahaemolyticus]|uniref:hypothetical protein n=1 Tax=Vibrio parahaemolyticus TaxID=670 RepID=UPI00226B34CE|nr:hypothetical protein [Vibrio parahaemolyticus]MCX8840455.1 hypothetical protein [Vibrio parahaemolyticus]HCG8859552.1 hypothetical protein [Vibrio parahaemolyticus]
MVKTNRLRRKNGKDGIFTHHNMSLKEPTTNEIKQLVADMNAQDDPLRLAESYEKAAISYIESFGYEYKTSGQQTIKLSKEERERRLKVSNEAIREVKNLKGEDGPLTIDDIEKEYEVCWWNYLLAESEKQGKHGIRFALDVISITTQIKNGLEKGNYKYLFKLAMRLANCFSIMAIAQYEDSIASGRASKAGRNKQNSLKKERATEWKAFALLKDEEIREINPKLKSKLDRARKILDKVNDYRSKEGNGPVSIETIRKELPTIN